MERRHAFLVCLPILFGCATGDAPTVCEEAVDKYKDCQFEVEGGENLNCSGLLECSSKCALAASCEEMKVPQPASEYQTCLDACT